jgi:hypothetical protein
MTDILAKQLKIFSLRAAIIIATLLLLLTFNYFIYFQSKGSREPIRDTEQKPLSQGIAEIKKT